MIIREIKGYEHEVHIGDSVIKEVLKEELSNEAMDFVARIEETANDLLEMEYNSDELGKECVRFTIDILTEMYNRISCNTMNREDILKYFNEMYNKLEEQLNDGL